MITITNQYLNEHQTAGGAWTRAQFASIGIDWPPRKNWRKSAIGLTITPEQQEIFENPTKAKQNK